jgi:pimeloyl-ACP methyl ester carboxylesterase
MPKALILAVLLATPLTSQTERPEPVVSSEIAPATVQESVVVTTSSMVLSAAQPAPRSRASFEVVEIRTSDKIELEGSWYKPRRKGKQVAGVLLIHDAGGNRAQMANLAERLQKLQMAVLTVDLRGHGGSKTEEIDWLESTEEERTAHWVHAQKDVDAAVDWLLSRKEVHSARLCMVGHGAGCALVVRHMKDDESAIGVVLLEPPMEAFGFNVKRDLVFLEGLPTRIVGGRDQESKMQAMVKDANEAASSGNPYIDLLLGRQPVLEDTAVVSKVSKFLKEEAEPSKGTSKGKGR